MRAPNALNTPQGCFARGYVAPCSAASLPCLVLRFVCGACVLRCAGERASLWPALTQHSPRRAVGASSWGACGDAARARRRRGRASAPASDERRRVRPPCARVLRYKREREPTLGGARLQPPALAALGRMRAAQADVMLALPAGRGLPGGISARHAACWPRRPGRLAARLHTRAHHSNKHASCLTRRVSLRLARCSREQAQRRHAATAACPLIKPLRSS